MRLAKNQLAVMDFAAKETTRYAINGVKLEQSGTACRAVATDGRRLIKLDWQSPANGSIDAIIGRELLKDAGKLIRSDVAVSVKDGQASIGIVAGPVDEGTFPKYSDIFDGLEADAKVVRFNPYLLGEALIAMAKSLGLERGTTCGVDLHIGDPKRPMRITGENNGATADVVIMPVSK